MGSFAALPRSGHRMAGRFRRHRLPDRSPVCAAQKPECEPARHSYNRPKPPTHLAVSCGDCGTGVQNRPVHFVHRIRFKRLSQIGAPSSTSSWSHVATLTASLRPSTILFMWSLHSGARALGSLLLCRRSRCRPFRRRQSRGPAHTLQGPSGRVIEQSCGLAWGRYRSVLLCQRTKGNKNPHSRCTPLRGRRAPSFHSGSCAPPILRSHRWSLRQVHPVRR